MVFKITGVEPISIPQLISSNIPHFHYYRLILGILIGYRVERASVSSTMKHFQGTRTLSMKNNFQRFIFSVPDLPTSTTYHITHSENKNS